MRMEYCGQRYSVACRRLRSSASWGYLLHLASAKLLNFSDIYKHPMLNSVKSTLLLSALSSSAKNVPVDTEYRIQFFL